MKRFKRFNLTPSFSKHSLTAKKHYINSDLRIDAPITGVQTMRGLLDPERFIFPFLTRQVPFLWAESLLANFQNWVNCHAATTRPSVFSAVLCSVMNISYGKNADRKIERYGCNRKWTNSSTIITSFFGFSCTYLCMIGSDVSLIYI